MVVIVQPLETLLLDHSRIAPEVSPSSRHNDEVGWLLLMTDVQLTASLIFEEGLPRLQARFEYWLQQ